MKTKEMLLQLFTRKITGYGRKKLPPALTRKITETYTKIELSCGAELDVKLFFPVCRDIRQWPVILVRNPYYGNNVILGTVLRLFAEQGYAVVFVTVRGALKSTGEWIPFVHEREDGREVVDWIAKQPWCDGNIGTFGGSYLGHVQWSLADYEHPALKAMCISVYGTSGYDLFWRRGMFRQEIWTPWAGQMMEENRYKESFPEDFNEKTQTFRPQDKLGEHLVGKPCGWYLDWIKHPKETDAYWSEGFWKEFEEGGRNAKVPMLLQGGWFDIFQRSQFRAFRQLPEEIRRQSRFIVGPWDHGDPVFGMMQGKPKYPEEDVAGLICITAAVEWFDHMLKGKPYPHEKGVIDAYCLGENRWYSWKGDIPKNRTLTMYLNAEEQREISRARRLDADNSETKEQVNYVYDPENPVPMLGMPCLAGSMATPGLEGNKLFQPKPGFRDDVISFVSEPLEKDVMITGAMRMNLFVSSDAKATAFTVHVMEMRSDGNSDSIREDITDIRWREEKKVEDYTPGSVVKVCLEMKDIVCKVKKGSRLRIDISSSCFPQYHVHPNTDEDWSAGGERKAAHQSVWCGGAAGSCIEIPILAEE